MVDPNKPRPTDNAFLGGLRGGSLEPTYGGALSFMRRRYSRDLAGVDAVVWGVPFDAAVSNRPGARFGPQAIRRASAIFDGDPQYPFALDPFATLAVIDYGDCSFDYGRPAEIPAAIEAAAAAILASGVALFTLGGDHFVTYPILKAHAAVHGPLALIQFDAHQDTWTDPGERIDHGTFVGRAVREHLIDPGRSIQIGIRTQAPEDCGIAVIGAYDVDRLGVRGVADEIRARVGEARAYLTFDIDCLDPAFAPGTGTPVAGGLSSREALAILRALGSIDFVGGDVVEVSPPYDHADVTAIAGATVAMYYLGLLAERRRGD
jgi:agmatinase